MTLTNRPRTESGSGSPIPSTSYGIILSKFIDELEEAQNCFLELLWHLLPHLPRWRCCGESHLSLPVLRYPPSFSVKLFALFSTKIFCNLCLVFMCYLSVNLSAILLSAPYCSTYPYMFRLFASSLSIYLQFLLTNILFTSILSSLAFSLSINLPFC